MNMATETRKTTPAATATLTVRHIPVDVDAAITAQAKAAGKSKSDFVQEFLTATFGDLIGNFIRTSELVALMDREVAGMLHGELNGDWFEVAMSRAENEVWCHILGIHSCEELQRIMMAAVPLLELRASQLKPVNSISPGTSLMFALFIEATMRDLATLCELHEMLFFLQKEEDFLDMVDQIREARRLPPVLRPVF